MNYGAEEYKHDALKKQQHFNRAEKAFWDQMSLCITLPLLMNVSIDLLFYILIYNVIT